MLGSIQSTRLGKLKDMLRTVPTKYKVDLSKGYWNPQRKLGIATHFTEIISLESRIRMPLSAFTYRQANAFIKIFKRHGK